MFVESREHERNGMLGDMAARLGGVMTDAPETHYTRSADGTNLAYQLSGDGPLDLVFLPSGAIAIDLLLEDPGFVRVRQRLGTFSRIVWFDRRGWGASEGDPWQSPVGETVDADLTAVLDAVGFERPALVADTESGLSAIHFVATHPERVSALVLVNAYAHYVREEDYPWGVPPERFEQKSLTSKQAGHGRSGGGHGAQPDDRRAFPSVIRWDTYCRVPSAGHRCVRCDRVRQGERPPLDDAGAGRRAAEVLEPPSPQRAVLPMTV
jgi:pimeloyl-ACP methyl ester carboxylesterase